MAADIGKLALKLTVDAASMAGDLAKATVQIGGFGKKVSETFKKALSFDLKGLASQGEKFSKVLETAIKDPLSVVADAFGGIATIADKIPVVGGLLALPFQAAAGAADLFSEAIGRARDEMLKLGAAASRIGVDISKLQVVASLKTGGGEALGVEAAEKFMTRFSKALGAAAVQGKFADNVFNKLGLDATELASGDKLGALKKFSDALQGTSNTILQSKYLLEVGGKQALLLAPALRKGAAGIEEVEKKLKAFGLGVGQGAFRSALELQKRAGEFKAIREGFFNQLSQAALPILGEINALFPKIEEGFGGLAPKIIDFVKVAGLEVAKLVDAFESGKFWEKLEGHANKFFALVLEGIADIVKALPSIGEVLRAQLPASLQRPALVGQVGIELALGGLGGGTGAGGIEGSLRAEAARRRGLAEVAAAVPVGTERQSAFGRFMDRVAGRTLERTAFDASEALATALASRAHDLERALVDPAKKFSETVLDTLDLFSKSKSLSGFFGEEARGFLGIGGVVPSALEQAFPELKAKVIGKAVTDLIAGSGLGEAKAAPGLVRDSAQAAAAIQAFQRQAERADPIEALKAIQEMQLEQQRENVRATEAVERAVREGRLRLVGGP